MKRLLIIGTLVLLVLAGAGWVVLSTRGVDYDDFQTRLPKVLESTKIRALADYSTEVNTVPLPFVVKWNPRFWNERHWFPAVVGVRGFRCCEFYELESHSTRLQCCVRHTAEVMQYAEIHYQWDYQEVQAEQLAGALNWEFPGLMVRTCKGLLQPMPMTYSVAARYR